MSQSLGSNETFFLCSVHVYTSHRVKIANDEVMMIRWTLKLDFEMYKYKNALNLFKSKDKIETFSFALHNLYRITFDVVDSGGHKG